MRPLSRLPELQEVPLADHADAERVDALWRRIDRSLEGDAVASALSDRALGATPAGKGWRVGARLVWAPAVAAAIFGLGVVVGARALGPEQVAPMRVTAEPIRSLARVAVAPTLASSSGRRALVAATSPERSERSAAAGRPRHRRLGAQPAERLPAPTQEVEVESVEPPAAPTGPPEWQSLADSGLYAEALARIEQAGGYDQVSGEASAEQLMLLVDVARATGERARAIQALRRIVNQHGSDPNAPVAAWMLGNELTKAGDVAGASQAFAMYRALSPQGDFAEDALARQFDVALEQGDLDQATRLAEQYARDFPEGRRGEDMAARLGEAVAARAQLAEEQAERAEATGRQGAPPEDAAGDDPGAHGDDSAGSRGGSAQHAEGERGPGAGDRDAPERSHEEEGDSTAPAPPAAE